MNLESRIGKLEAEAPGSEQPDIVLVAEEPGKEGPDLGPSHQHIKKHKRRLNNDN